jgi:rod shape determining protein RodA
VTAWRGPGPNRGRGLPGGGGSGPGSATHGWMNRGSGLGGGIGLGSWATRGGGLGLGGRAGLGTLSGPAERQDSLWRRLDWAVLGSALLLSGLGSLLVWSATRPRLLEAGGDPQAFLRRHLMNLVIGLVLGAVVALVDYRMLRVYAPIIYIGSFLGLVAVLLIGVTINGAHSWIVIGGGFQLQPSEFAKFALVLVMAMVINERRTQEYSRRNVEVPIVLALAAVPLGLVMLQPDAGTAMVLVFTVFCVLGVAGVSARWLLGLILAGALAGTAAVQLHVLADYQLDRFKVFNNPDQETQGAAYNITQARIAIGAGGLFGTGLFHGSQTNGKFVPEQQTDFVFTVAGEELGLVGAGGIILLFGLLLWRPISRHWSGELVRLPDLHQHRDDARHHAGDRAAAPVRLVRRVLDVRELDGDRPATERTHATTRGRATDLKNDLRSLTSSCVGLILIPWRRSSACCWPAARCSCSAWPCPISGARRSGVRLFPSAHGSGGCGSRRCCAPTAGMCWGGTTTGAARAEPARK